MTRTGLYGSINWRFAGGISPQCAKHTYLITVYACKIPVGGGMCDAIFKNKVYFAQWDDGMQHTNRGVAKISFLGKVRFVLLLRK